MPKLAANEYQCVVCRGVFEKGWTDEEAHAERERLLPGVPIEECEIACDDCFTMIRLGFCVR
jgi:hypothetical protein